MSRTNCVVVVGGGAAVADDGGECQRKAGKPFVSIDLVTASEVGWEGGREWGRASHCEGRKEGRKGMGC